MNIQTRWKIFVVIYRPTPLLTHFVRHYSAAGFTDIFVAASELCGDLDWQRIREAAGNAEVHVEPLYRGVFDNMRDTLILNAMKARYVEEKNEWCAVVDLDELDEYPFPLVEIAETAGNANCVQGFFLDRVAADGSLPAISEHIPIAEQFPVEVRVTKRIVGGNDRKLILTRGFQPLYPGQHGMLGEQLFPHDGLVLHYKWNSNVMDHLEERVRTRDLTGYAWTHESERFFDYWQRNGRIVFEDCF